MRPAAGFILIEATVVYFLAAVVVVSVASVYLLAHKAGKRTQDTLLAAQLAAELLEEVRLRRFDETTPAARPGYPAYALSALGPDAGESAADKRTFDDVDDFQGWSESPPQDPVLRAVAGLSGWQRTVSVGYVTAALAASGSPTDYKRVTVCAQRGVAAACLDWLAVNR